MLFSRQLSDRLSKPSALGRGFAGDPLAGPVLIGLVLLGLCLPAQAELSRVDKLKATYLFNFIKFIEWPALSTADNSIHLCSTANDEFNQFLKELIGRRPMGAGQVKLQPIEQPQQAEDCQLLYLRSYSARFDAHQLSALVVGDTPKFSQLGAAMRFYRSGNYVRFEANPQALARKNIQLSSQLLKLSRIVEQ